MIAETILYINVLTGVSLTVYTFLHMIFNNRIPYKKRAALLFPGFSMVCYTLTAIEWLYSLHSTGPDSRHIIWAIVAWMIVMSVGIITHFNWSIPDAKRY